MFRIHVAELSLIAEHPSCRLDQVVHHHCGKGKTVTSREGGREITDRELLIYTEDYPWGGEGQSLDGRLRARGKRY